MGFEPDLKLTEEMLELMGGRRSEYYRYDLSDQRVIFHSTSYDVHVYVAIYDTCRWFLDLCVQGYLAVRPYQEQVVSLVCLMLDTGFPCFRGNTIEPLGYSLSLTLSLCVCVCDVMSFVCFLFRARFRPQFSEKDAAKAIVEVVESSCLNFRYVCTHTM